MAFLRDFGVGRHDLTPQNSALFLRVKSATRLELTQKYSFRKGYELILASIRGGFQWLTLLELSSLGKRNKMRKITSLTALLAFSLLMLTSIILYIVPQGRVAYWADWRLWGLSKTQWTDIHINLGLLFLVSIGLHLYYNWKPILAYMKNKAKKIRVFTRDFNVALLVTTLFIAGTYWGLPPFSWVLALNANIKDNAAIKYGEPPYGHAELASLQNFVVKMQFDLNASISRLAQNGIVVDHNGQSLQDIARINAISPQQVYLALKPAENTANPDKKLPALPPTGFGQRPLVEICREYNVDLDALLRHLAEKKLDAGPDQSLKEIAEQNNMGPLDVYDLFKGFANSEAMM
jgi:hypothetical protein